MPVCPSNELPPLAAYCRNSRHHEMLHVARDSEWASWWRYSGLTQTGFNQPGIDRTVGYRSGKSGTPNPDGCPAHLRRQDLLTQSETERVLSAGSSCRTVSIGPPGVARTKTSLRLTGHTNWCVGRNIQIPRKAFTHDSRQLGHRRRPPIRLPGIGARSATDGKPRDRQ